MKQHKWHKEIKAWADGAEIEFWNDERETWSSIFVGSQPRWYEDVKYRIKPQPKEPQFEEYITPYADVNIIFKPQPKEPQPIPSYKGDPTPTHVKEPKYLYVWLDKEEDKIEFDNYPVGEVKEDDVYKYIGKLKLEEDDK